MSKGRYINRSHKCDYCGELARRDLHPDVPECWSDGRKIIPMRNKTRGIICADCQWFEFEDFCHSHGASPYNPVLYFN